MFGDVFCWRKCSFIPLAKYKWIYFPPSLYAKWRPMSRLITSHDVTLRQKTSRGTMWRFSVSRNVALRHMKFCHATWLYSAPHEVSFALRDVLLHHTSPITPHVTFRRVTWLFGVWSASTLRDVLLRKMASDCTTGCNLSRHGTLNYATWQSITLMTSHDVTLHHRTSTN